MDLLSALFPLCWALLWFLSSPGWWHCTLGLYIGIVLALLDRSGFPALEMGELRVTPPRGPSPASKGEQLLDGAFWELESLEEAPHSQRFPEAVPWARGTGQVSATLVSHWHSRDRGGQGCGARMGWDKPCRAAPWQSSPFPLSLPLGQPWEHPAPPAPSAPLRGQLWDLPLGRACP